MNIFKKKKPELTAVLCSQCGGPLELDANYETAHCQICGTQHVVHNFYKKKRQKRTNFEMVIDFIEKERDYKRKDRVEKKKIKTEQAQIAREESKKANKYLLIFGIIFGVLMIVLFVLTEIGVLV